MLKELIIAFGIAAICVVIHINALIILAGKLLDWRSKFDKLAGFTRYTLILNMVFAIIIILHLVETAIWATAYLWWELFSDYETALYFSLTSYTTIGYGDVVLPEKWRLLGGIEGISGVLLCGVSTAFIFVVLNDMHQVRRQKQGKT